MLLPVRRALLSVSDKTGLVELARALSERNIEILSTGGTAKLLAANGIAVREVASYTGFPEIMDGRVKTLHPKIHGGLLGRRGIDEAVMASDAFFPFRDGLDVAAEYGIRAVIQPGGSKKDPEVIAAADEHGIAMVFTGMRHFRH